MGYFADRTYENILQEVLEEGEALGVSTRKGDVFYDAVSAACFKLAKYYADLDNAFELLFITTAKDQFLNLRGEEFNVYRNDPTKALYEFRYTGSTPAIGDRFFTNGLYFILTSRENIRDGALILEAETAGDQYNTILEGTPAVPDQTVADLTASSFGAQIEPGANIEGNEPYRRRIREKVAGPAQNGNRQHFKTWCESIGGISRARGIPLFAGENTFMSVLIGADGTPAASTLVDEVQKYIDPITQHLTVQFEGKTIEVGDGLGNGVANVGAHFAAVAAEPVVINISALVTIKPPATIDQVINEATQGFQAILKEIAIDTPEDEDMVVRMSSMGACLFSLTTIRDYTNLALNNAASNIDIRRTQVAVLGEVDIRAV